MTDAPKWATSDAKRKLTRMIKNPESTLHTTMTFDELHKMEAFRVYKRDNLRRNVGRLYKSMTGNDKVWPKTKTKQKTKERRVQSVNKSANEEKSQQVKKKKKSKIEPWKQSVAKAFLLKLLIDPDRPLKDMSAKEIYDSHTVFQQYPFSRFKDNMRSLAKQVKRDKEWAKIEGEDIERDMKLVPRNKTTIRGYPFWNTHKANELLHEDVKSGKRLY